MLQKVFILFFAFIALAEGGGMCAATPGGPADTPCPLIPECQFAENGSLTPIATVCSNQLPDSDCQQLFVCDSAATAPCDPTLAAEPAGDPVTPETIPNVRSLACTSPNLQNIANQCARTCALCCQAPEYNCADDDRSPIDCEQNRGKCRDANWTNIMAQYCPRTCGLCTNGTCRDLNTGCNTMTSLCRHVDWISYMTTNCARTCAVCNTTTTTPSGSTCSDIASNCAPNANLCTNATYRTLMLQQCCATCGGTSSAVPAVSCTDSDSNCATYVRNGFCSSTFYTTAQKRQYCARSCSLC